MICKGDKLENPVTGKVLIFHRTSRETGGQAVLVETIVRPRRLRRGSPLVPTRKSGRPRGLHGQQELHPNESLAASLIDKARTFIEQALRGCDPEPVDALLGQQDLCEPDLMTSRLRHPAQPDASPIMLWV